MGYLTPISLNTGCGRIMASHYLVSRPGCHDPTPGEKEKRDGLRNKKFQTASQSCI